MARAALARYDSRTTTANQGAKAVTETLDDQLRQILGAGNVRKAHDVAPSAWDTHQDFQGRLLLTPGSVAELAEVLRACHQAAQPIVPIGGMTNLVQGCATRQGDIGLSLARLDAIEEVDRIAQTMTVQAGVTLAAAQQAAEAVGLFLPVDIGSRDNCMIGGNVATNAGGTKVIRYGMIRDSVLGLEAVLADGTVISSLNRYLKNNSGFDLKHLFIGTEGTLGVITRIVLRLADAPATHNVALLAAESYADIIAVLDHVRAALGGALCGFEVMWQEFYEKATSSGPHTSPLAPGYPFYAIVEAMGHHPGQDDVAFENVFAALLDDERIADGVIAKSGKERNDIWAIRHEVEWLVSGAYNFDVSLRIADVGDYVNDITERIRSHIPDALVAAFGHLGDNNVHVSVLAGRDNAASIVAEQVYEGLRPYAGAISAEHGIGLEKREYLPVSRNEQEIELMHALKRMLDPANILNPGKVIDASGEDGGQEV